MSKLTKAVGAQWPLVAEFEFNFDDTMVNTAGDEVAFGAEDAALTTFDIMTPPPGAVVNGGTIQNVKPFAGATASTLDLGDSDDPDRFTPTIHDMASATAQTVLTPAGAGAKVYDGSQKIRATILNTVTAATAGKVRIAVSMSVKGRQTENLRTN